MKAFNCNDSQRDWTSRILSGQKTIETRNSHSLGSLVGQRVGIIQTGIGRARLVGYVTISGAVIYDDEVQFRTDEPLHHVPRDLAGYEWTGAKVGYVLSDPERIPPQILPPSCRGIVIRNLPETYTWQAWQKRCRNKWTTDSGHGSVFPV